MHVASITVPGAYSNVSIYTKGQVKLVVLADDKNIDSTLGCTSTSEVESLDGSTSYKFRWLFRLQFYFSGLTSVTSCMDT